MLKKFLQPKEADRSAEPATQDRSQDDNRRSRAADAGDGRQDGRRKRRKRKPASGGRAKQNRTEQVIKAATESDWVPAQFEVYPEPGKTRFHDLNLPDVVMHAIADLGFQYCSPIQAQTLPHSLQGADITGKAQTGTGKTAAFLVSIITDLVDYPLEGGQAKGTPRALILAPTRELVLQIAKDAHSLSTYTGLNILTVVGGMDFERQKEQLLNEKIDILVATPGRLIDFIGRGMVNLREVEVLVLDEADRMLSMGFIPDVRRIIRQTPRKGERQTLLFSATFSQDILALAAQWTENPVYIEIESERVTTDSVDQQAYLVGERDKYKVVRNLIQQRQLSRVMVFANRRDQTRRLFERLQKDGLKVAMLSGEVVQKKRIATLEAFRSGQIEVLVATDVAGRGIHVEDVSHVINYNLPEDLEDYVHRIGRTGRAGKTGTSISLIGEDDAFLLPELEAMIGQKLSCEHPSEELLNG
ncbi:ATP-dependent RNA helicase RhlB [Balneatrix alpica]|uniref:ATP-dependent RNA helicase RhlB n=1 Tax=Balneatrix alpica TaxID=75684 RepID=UPI00273A38FC|nr:ATP-dependent RNA helicase RhlB [Balneatrix alpica]